MSQAKLQTDRIELVPLSDEHFELEVALDSDPEVMRYLTCAGRTRAQVTSAHQLRMATAEAVPGLGFWVGFVDGQFVGWWLLEPSGGGETSLIEGEAELGYRLLRRYWRQGLASEGSRALLRHAFEDLGMHRVFALTMSANTASRATMAAVGLQHVRTFVETEDDGSARETVEYALTRDDWLASLARGVADIDLVRESYDRVADNYVEMGVGDLGPEPWLRAALTAFAEDVRGLGPVLDVGCGPGTVTAYLAELGLDIAGIDLSPRMVEHARRLHPGLRFAVGSATDTLDDNSFGGLLGWWSLFNLPRAVVADVLASFARALVPGGQVLIGTHVGDGDLHRTSGYGDVPIRWTTHLWQPDQLRELLEAAGLELVAELRFPPKPDSRAQVVLAARRP